MSRKPARAASGGLQDPAAMAEQAAKLLEAMANPKRMLVLCKLLEGERSVGDLAAIVGLSQGALSQHLGKMRALDFVATRREAQTVYYRIASDHVRAVLKTLYAIYCKPAAAKSRRTA
ncbi:MAG: helix-turn-helix transcriptional regulator [Rhizobiales bacterium]|nr:helix-turn-helix transcriptional regulator [Hyphomicrobiales bacterium]